MVKPTIVIAGVCSFLVCFQSSAAGNEAGAVELSKTQVDYRRTLDEAFEKQDMNLERARDYVARGEYLKAINMFKDVHGELELLVTQIDSWKARKRYEEVSRERRELELRYGKILLGNAKTALNEGRYNDAISLGAQVIAVCPVLSEDAVELQTIARSRQRGEERLHDVAAERVIPDLPFRERNINAALSEARVLMKNRRFEEARRRIEAVYKINPFNQEAAYLATQIYSQYYTAGYHRSQADVRSLMAGEAWQWVEPVFYRNVGKGEPDATTVKAASDAAIQRKLDSIVIPRVQYEDGSIGEVINHLMSQCKRFDKSVRPGEKSVGIIIDYIPMNDAAIEAAKAQQAAAAARQAQEAANNENLDAPEAPQEGNPQNPQNPQDAAAAQGPKEVLINLKADNVTVREVLDYISFLTDLPYRVLPDRVTIGAVGDDLKAETFAVTPEAIMLIAGDSGNAPGAEGEVAGGDGGNKEEGELVEGKVMDVDLNPETLRNFFESFGVDFRVPGSNIVYENGKITMTNTQENLNRMSELLRQMNTPRPMVKIELKTIEISENDMEELGFQWSLGTIGRSNGHDSSWEAGQGTNTKIGRAMNAIGSSLTGVGATLVDNLNLFPDIFGSIKPFDSDMALNLSLTINALDRNDRTEMISAPSVIVSDRQTATVNLSTVYYFPESWEELEVELDGGDGDSGYKVQITRPMPEFDEQTDIGTIFSVTPQIKKNRIIGLHLTPKVTSYASKDSYNIPVIIERFNPKSGEFEVDNSLSGNFEVWKPVISTRSLDVHVNVFDGETLVLGGLSDSILTTRLDKIPILGDIPFIGRLFQSQSEVSTRKNTLIFVTARLVDYSGLPVHAIEKDGGIPDVNR